jgi:hypothetical protein
MKLNFSGMVPTPAGTQLWADNVAASYCQSKINYVNQAGTLNNKIAQSVRAQKTALQQQLSMLNTAWAKSSQDALGVLSKFGYKMVGCKAVKDVFKHSKSNFKTGTINGSDCYGRDGQWHPMGSAMCNGKVVVIKRNPNAKLGL